MCNPTRDSVKANPLFGARHLVEEGEHLADPPVVTDHGDDRPFGETCVPVGVGLGIAPSGAFDLAEPTGPFTAHAKHGGEALDAGLTFGNA